LELLNPNRTRVACWRANSKTHLRRCGSSLRRANRSLRTGPMERQMISSEAHDRYLHEMAARVLRELRLALETERMRNRELSAENAALKRRLALRVLGGGNRE
jgi:hypothetical protein